MEDVARCAIRSPTQTCCDVVLEPSSPLEEKPNQMGLWWSLAELWGGFCQEKSLRIGESIVD